MGIVDKVVPARNPFHLCVYYPNDGDVEWGHVRGGAFHTRDGDERQIEALYLPEGPVPPTLVPLSPAEAAVAAAAHAVAASVAAPPAAVLPAPVAQVTVSL